MTTTDDRPAGRRARLRLKPRRTVVAAVVAVTAVLGTLLVANTSAGFNDSVDIGSWPIETGEWYKPPTPDPIQTLTESEDAWVQGGNPRNTNYGDTPYLRVHGDPDAGQNPGRMRTLVQFRGLDDVLDAIPDGYVVTDAFLNMHQRRGGQNSLLVRHQAHLTAGPWDEHVVTYANHPDYQTTGPTSPTVDIPNQNAGWREFDVTAHVNAIRAGTFPNHGFLIRANPENGTRPGGNSLSSEDYRAYDAREAGSSTAPYLELHVAPAP